MDLGKLDADYKKSILSIEKACELEREKIQREADALKAKAMEIGKAVEVSS